jgi:outer membrane protein with beta-barrel domain
LNPLPAAAYNFVTQPLEFRRSGNQTGSELALSKRGGKEAPASLGECMTTKTILKMFLLVIVIAPAARAQAPLVAGIAPVLEAGGGYTYTDASVPSQNKLGMNGAQLVGDADFSRRFGVQLELGYSRNFNAYSSNHTADMLTYLGGPVFYPLRTRRWTVNTHVLAGGARETGVNFESDGQIIRGYTNRFAWAVGAGVQYRVSRDWSVRIGADYLRTSFFNSDVQIQGQLNIRSSATLIYTFGEGRE